MKKRLASLLFLFLVFVAAFTCPLSAQEKPKSHQDSITIEELRDHLFYLASDYLKGRDTGSTDYLIAAQYAASQFREAGLKSVFKDADGRGTYFQPVEIVCQKYGDKTQVNLQVGGNESTLKYKESILVVVESKSGGKLEPTESVFLGYGIEEQQAGWDDYSSIDPAGKVAFILPGAPTVEGKPVLPESIHNKYEGLNGVAAKLGAAIKHKVALLVMVLAGQWAGKWENAAQKLDKEYLSLKDAASPGLIPIPMSILLVHSSSMVKAFAGTGFDPVKAVGEIKPAILNGVKVSVRMGKELYRSLTSPNVVGMVEGTDPELRDQYIVIGAHLDHEGVSDGKVYNGADDNASGSVAVLEAAEALAMAPPRRSVIFVLYTGEEKGDLGSKSFIKNCPVPIEDIVLNINMDMIGRNDEEFPEGVYALGSERRSKELKQILIDVNEKTVRLPLDFRYDENDPEDFWMRSDQASFDEKGIPAIFFTSGLHPDYHTPADDAEKINYMKIRSMSQLCYELTMSIGNRDAKLKIDAE